MSYQRRNDRSNRPPPQQSNNRQLTNRNWREPEDKRPPQQAQNQRRSRPPSQRKRDAVRQDTFRENHPKSQQALKDIEDKINKALYFGFGDSLTAEKQVDFYIQKTAAVVPVTTRAVGFYTQWMYKKVYELYGRRPDRIPECSPYSFYRVSLAQFEYRLLCGKAQINTLGTDAGLFYRPRLDIEHRDVIKSMPLTFSPLANLLAGVGNFEYEGEAYYVKCPVDHILGTLFSNLEHTVVAMANPATPQAARQLFYDLNPLPFALWNQPARAGIRRRQDGQPPIDPGFPLLLNPNEFWPAGYDVEAFEHDVHQVKNFISFVARKEIKILREGALIDYEATGHQRILVSNSAEGLRNPDRLFQNQWADENLPQGDLNAFWTPVTLKSQDFLMGTINLVGERRPGAGDAFAFRSPLIARGQARHRWTTLIDNMIA